MGLRGVYACIRTGRNIGLRQDNDYNVVIERLVGSRNCYGIVQLK